MATADFKGDHTTTLGRAILRDSAARATTTDLIAESRPVQYNTSPEANVLKALAATTSPQPAQTSTNEFTLTAGQLVGIVIGGSIIVIGIPLAVYYWMHKRKQRLQRQHMASSIEAPTGGPRMSVSSSIAPSLSPTTDGPSRQNTFRSVLSTDHLTVIHEMEGERALISDRRITFDH